MRSIIFLYEKQQSVPIHKHVGKPERTWGRFMICSFAPWVGSLHLHHRLSPIAIQKVIPSSTVPGHFQALETGKRGVLLTK